MTESEMKMWIDGATYEQLLRRWRDAPLGEQIFVGEMGSYYARALFDKKAALPTSEAVQVSKRVGWNQTDWDDWDTWREEDEHALD